jgi:clan AA aspartic protease
MIQGSVDQNLQAKVPVSILDKADKISTLDAVVDTGFSGHLSISVYELHKINLIFSHSQKFELGDGRIVRQKVFLGQIIFDNQKLAANVLVSKSRDTLIGTALLTNKKLEIDYTNIGVQIRNSKKKATRKN